MTQTQRLQEWQIAQTAAVYSKLDLGPPHLRPVLGVLEDFGCVFSIVRQRFGKFEILIDKPTILVVGDNMEKALGPAGFHRKSLGKYIATCGAAVVVACEPQPGIYEAAASVAALGRANAVLIETHIQREREWVDFVQGVNPEILMFLATLEPAAGVH